MAHKQPLRVPRFGDVDGYATTGGTSASVEGGRAGMERNTQRSIKGAAIPCGEFTNSDSRDMPGSVEPYANESRMSAAERDGDGL